LVTFTRVYTVTFMETGLASGSPWSVTFNGTRDNWTATSFVFSEPNGSYSYTVAPVGNYTVNRTTGTVTVSGADQLLWVGFNPVPGTYYVTFDELGLAPGTPWNLTLNGVTRGAASAGVVFTEPNGSYTFRVDPYNRLTDYTIIPKSGSVTVYGASVRFDVDFQEITYGVTFIEAGLPSGTGWWVNITGGPATYSANSTVVFGEPNGSYDYMVQSANGYAASPASGTVTVAGVNRTVSVTFRPTYAVIFSETGLTTETDWAVGLNGTWYNSSSTTITFLEPNGSYPYQVENESGYSVSPVGWSVTVNGAAQTVPVRFTPYSGSYYVTFNETGLASGTSWSVILGGTSATSASTTIAIVEPNGTYSFSVGSVSGYNATPTSGNVVVSGHAVTRTITFTAANSPTYAVTFVETGLPTGTGWSVNLSGTLQASNSTSVVFAEPSGQYGWHAAASVNGSPLSVFGNVTVNGNGVTVAVAFPNATGGLFLLTFQGSGLPPGTNWSVTLSATSGGLTIEANAALTRWSDGAAAVAFRVSEGTYGYSTYAPGYRTVSDTVSVSRTTPSAVTVSFVAVGSTPGQPSNPSVLGLSASGAAIGLAFVLIGALGSGLTIYRYRTREKERGHVAVAQISEASWARDEHGEPAPRTNH
jgi:hypothetical protein